MKRVMILALPLFIISLTSILPGTYADEPKVVMVEQKIITKKEGPNSFLIIAEGKVKNNGKSAVKNLVITAECLECSNGRSKWRALQPEFKIDYIASGDKEGFEFDIAVWRSIQKSVFPPDPSGLKLRIESFENM